VNVYSPEGRIRGKGMTLSLDTGLVELNSDVQGIYDVYQ
jgi:lipopolysaccharide export system protein LptC